MINENSLAVNRSILSTFLIETPIPKRFCLENPSEVPFGYIYCLLNKINGKKYIGSTYSIWVGIKRPTPYSSLHKRASHYIYEYNAAIASITNGNKKTFRPIIQAMIDDGIENFIMYPVAETRKSTHTVLENYFIDEYDTINNGYNVNKAGLTISSGHTMSIKDKILRSQGIIAVNMNQQKIVISQSMKLFADFMNTSKDMIKNVNRKGKPYKGWFVFYLDPDKRSFILENNVINDQDKRPQDRHSDKTKNFYKGLYTSVSLYLNDIYTNEGFPGFERLSDLVYKEE